MKGLKTFIWMGCLSLGITLTVPMPSITQSLASSEEIINFTNSWTESKRPQRNYSIPQVITRITRYFNQYDNFTGHVLNGSNNPVTTGVTITLGKRSVKRDGVNYFENVASHSILSDSLRQRFKNLYVRRHKRMVEGSNNVVVKNERERKLQILREADHRRKESALRRKEIRDEKLVKVKNRRKMLKDTREVLGKSHDRRSESDSEEIRENREKIRDSNRPQRPLIIAHGNHKSSARIDLLSKRKSRLIKKRGGFGKINCRKLVNGKKHKSSIVQERNCGQGENKKNPNGRDNSKASARKNLAAFDSKSKQRKSSSNIEKNSAKNMRKNSEKNSKENGKSKITAAGRKNEIESNTARKTSANKQQKSKKSKGLDRKAASRRSDDKTHKSTVKHGNKNLGKEKDIHKSSAKKTRQKLSKNRKVKQQKASKNEKKSRSTKSQKRVTGKGRQDMEEQDEETIEQRKEGKQAKSKISAEKHSSVESEEKSTDGEVTSREHKYKQEGRKHLRRKVKKLDTPRKGDSKKVGVIKNSSDEKSSKLEDHHSVKKSRSSTKSENCRRIDKKLKPLHEMDERGMETKERKRVQNSKKETTKKDGGVGRPSFEKKVNEIDYLGHVLGYGLGNRKRLQSKSQARSLAIHKRPMTGGYASSGRLTRALSNLHGASASAGI